jgi:hypothetical protein
MGKTVRASALILFLACSTFAGEIQNGVTGTPPPPQNATQEQQTVDGDIQNGVADSLSETVLSLIERVLVLTLL